MPKPTKQALPRIGIFSGTQPRPADVPVHWRYVHCAEHHFDENYWNRPDPKPCGCPPGPQVKAYFSAANETGIGGGRGGLKSETGRIVLLKGNPRKKPECPADHSYINHPRYRALVIRKNQTDLSDWIERARQLYAPMGAVYSHDREIRFPSGATIVLGHMADENAFEKYQGQEFTRILIEELTQIPSELLYLRIIMSCRSTIPELVPQVWSTFNPGGPGHSWVTKRFVKLFREDGTRVKPGEIYTDPLTGNTRMFVFSKVTDNPYLMRDRSYISSLMGLPDEQRRAWLDGDFDALAGQYFTDFRERGPTEYEKDRYPHARHVIPAGSVELMPWWPRWVGMDWGYKHNTAAYWFCQHPNGQVHVYRELCVNQMGAEELGVEIALSTMKDLRGMAEYDVTAQLSVYLSPDAFDKRDATKTRAELIQNGINSVLGDGSAVLHDAEGLPSTMAKIIICKAQNQRVSGWQYMHSLMRFRPLAKVESREFDQNYAMVLATQFGEKRYREYMRAFEKHEDEVLPKLQIWDSCPRLIAAIPSAVHDEKKNPEDVLKTDEPEDDILDSCRYGLHAHKFSIASVPKRYYVEERMRTAPADALADPTRAAFIYAKAEADYAAQNRSGMKPFSLQSSRRVN